MNKLIQYGSAAVIILSVIIAGYIILKPNTEAGSNANGLALMVDGKQAVNMTVLAVGYSPNSFTVKAGVPVRWEITSSGQPGCASGALISNLLPGGSVYLNPDQGQVTIVEFTPQKVGTYKFSCSMNMVRGTIEVVS